MFFFFNEYPLSNFCVLFYTYVINILNTIVGWKGNVYEDGNLFGETRNIDLANNKLTRKIPEELSMPCRIESIEFIKKHVGWNNPSKIIGQLEQLESIFGFVEKSVFWFYTY